MNYNPRDYFNREAKKKGFAARSIFKLEEIDQRFKIIKKGDRILDLGAAPGSWSQYCSQKVGANGRVLGIDLSEIALTLPNAVFIQKDIFECNIPEIADTHGIKTPFDVVLSDMAPKTTGIKETDQTRSFELCSKAFHISETLLKKDGHFVCKLFHSQDFENLRKELKGRFKKIELLKPKSTRKQSKEIFFICLSFQT